MQAVDNLFRQGIRKERKEDCRYIEYTFLQVWAPAVKAGYRLARSAFPQTTKSAGFGSSILIEQMRVLCLTPFPKVLDLHDLGKKRDVDGRFRGLCVIVLLENIRILNMRQFEFNNPTVKNWTDVPDGKHPCANTFAETFAVPSVFLLLTFGPFLNPLLTSPPPAWLFSVRALASLLRAAPQLPSLSSRDLVRAIAMLRIRLLDPDRQYHRRQELVPEFPL
jgi:hypothetical protein